MSLQQVARPAVVHLFGQGQVGSRFRHLVESNWAGQVVLGAIHTRKQSQLLAASRPDVLVDATAPQYADAAGADWIHRLAGALEEGISVVTCNKAPLALAWDELQRAARQGHARLAFNATVGAGTPVIGTLQRLQQVRGIDHVEGTLSGTLSFVLQNMANGNALQDAIAEAQRIGYAEPDPTLDLNGTDALAKAVILHNVLHETSLALEDAEANLDLHAIRPDQHPLGAVARIARGQVSLNLEATKVARPTPGQISVEAFHPDGTTTVIAGPGASPQATAACLLADIWQLAAPGGWR